MATSEGKPLPLAEFQAWLENELKIVRPVNNPVYPRIPPYQVEGESLAYMQVQLSDGAKRWVEISFPAGQPEELKSFFLRHDGSLSELGTIDPERSFPPKYNMGILLVAAIRFDLVIDAIDGRLMITPRGEWCPNFFAVTGIQNVDFSNYPEMAAAWQQEVRFNADRQYSDRPLVGIRQMIEDTPLKVDLTAVEPLGNWRPAIHGFGVPDGSIREQLRDLLFCSGLKCEQRGDTLSILPRWTVDREANYPPTE